MKTKEELVNAWEKSGFSVKVIQICIGELGWVWSGEVD